MELVFTEDDLSIKLKFCVSFLSFNLTLFCKNLLKLDFGIGFSIKEKTVEGNFCYLWKKNIHSEKAE